MMIIDLVPVRKKEKILAGALNPVRHLLPTDLIESWCREIDYDWRERMFGPVVTLLACVWQQLHDLSLREVDDWVASFLHDPESAPDGKAFCSARARLPKELLEKALRHVGSYCVSKAARVFHGMRVVITDGTTLRTPRQDAHYKRFGCARNGKGLRGSPLVRVVALVCLGSGAVRDVACGGFTEISEVGLFRKLVSTLSGALVLYDAGFVNFMSFVDARLHSTHVLGALKGTRKGTVIRKLGEGDELQLWNRPRRRDVKYWTEGCPETIEVRVITGTVTRPGYRPYSIKLCTTLLDAEKYPAAELVALYCERWKIETDFRTLKTLYPLGELSGKTPEVVEKEILSGLLAYNIVQAFMSETQTSPRKLSHARARQLLISQSERMAAAPTRLLIMLYNQLVTEISRCKLREQKKKPQPRRILPRVSKYPTLKSRKKWRAEYEAAS